MTDQALLTELQYALLEPPDGGQSFPSGVWTHDEVIDAVNAAERQLLRTTHLLVTRTELAVLAGATSVTLPAGWLATLHLVWRTAANVRHPLAPIDTTEVDLGEHTWETTPGTPKGYLDSDTETLKLRLAPVPDANGTIELLYVAVPTAVNGNGRSFTVPDEYISGVKYGGLETLLGKAGRLQDPTRAAYCRQRAQMVGIAAEIILGGFA
jgi:hypothetical protein